MGRKDARHSMKMRRIESQKKLKARRLRMRQGQRTHEKVTLKAPQA